MSKQSCLTCDKWLRDANEPYIGICAHLKANGCSDRDCYRFQYEICPRWSFGSERMAGREEVKAMMLETWA